MATQDYLPRRFVEVCLALAVLVVTGCAQMGDSAGESEAEAADAMIEQTGRALLEAAASEEDGFGLYSYVLFGSRPGAGSPTEDRYLAALQAYLDLVVPVDQVLEYTMPPDINITYLPVRSGAQETPDSLLAYYDYARAQHILAALPHDDRPLGQGGGPYIVSYRQPLTTIASGGAPIADEYLFQDLSSVPARVVRLWVGEFLSQVRQPEYWQERPLQDFALRFRTHLASMADFVESVPPGLLRELASVLFARSRA